MGASVGLEVGLDVVGAEDGSLDGLELGLEVVGETVGALDGLVEGYMCTGIQIKDISFAIRSR